MKKLSLLRHAWLLVVLTLVACQPVAPDPTAVPAPATAAPAAPTSTAANPPTRTPQPEPTATEAPRPIALSSTSFAAEAEIPDQFACTSYGDNVSPALTWGDLPDGTQSLALTMFDPDAGQYIHWLVANIPADAAGFGEGQVPTGAVEGRTTRGEVGYFGPCPDATHRYVFTLYALDVTTELEPGFGLIDFRMATDGHILGEGQLVGLYTP